MKRFSVKGIFLSLVFCVAIICGFLMADIVVTTNDKTFASEEITGTAISAEQSGSNLYGREYRGQIVVKNGSTYTMTGGTIDGACGMFGSAFYVENGATLNLAGGSIVNNRSKWGVVYVEAGGKVNITGEFTFKNNTTENSNFSHSSNEIPICVEDIEDVVVSEDVTITSENNTSDIYNVEIILCTEQTDGAKAYVKQAREIGCTFADYDFGLDLNKFNGYFTDTQYLDVLDEDVNLFETYQTGRLYVYSKQATIDNFTYTLSDNEYTVSVQTSTSGNLVIPATHEDLPVTQFSCVNCTSVTGLVLGSNITTIVQQNLFNAGITTLNVHSNVSTFTPYSSTNMLHLRSFANVNKLQAINVSDKNSVFIDLDSNGLFRKSDNALMFGCVSTDLSKKFAESSGSSINTCAFLGVPISSITIPSSVKTIGVGAFSWTSLTTVNISSVTSLGNYAFCECTNLQMVNLSNDLKTISRGAFEFCSALQSINIPTSLVNVLQDAFTGCTSFRGNYYSPGEFVFPSSVEKIYYAVFANCKSLDYVYIPSTARVMPTATSATYSLFGGDSNLVIATDASEDIVTTWGEYWNYYDGSNACTTYYGITLAEGQTIADAIALSGQVMATSNISDNKECDSDLSIATVNLNNVIISPVVYTFDKVKQDELEAEIVTLNNKKNEYVILSKEKDD